MGVRPAGGWLRAAAVCAALAGARAEGAHVLEVRSLADGPGECLPAAGDRCTYRAALAEAARFDDELPVLISLPAGRIVLSGQAVAPLRGKEVHIAGSPDEETILDGAGQLQLLIVHSTANVSVSDVTFSNGSAMHQLGTAVQGGAIFNDGRMQLSRCRMLSCHAAAGGGAIFNSGILSITDSTVSECTSAQSGGAIESQGPGSQLEVRGCLFERSRAETTGGAVECSGAHCLVADSVFIDHSAGTTGGTVHSTRGRLRLENSTLARSSASGGGLVHIDCAAGECSQLSAWRVTFSGGLATEGPGGAVLCGGHMELSDCSFEENYAGGAGPQGASIAIDQESAICNLANVSFDGSFSSERMVVEGSLPSEVWIGASSAEFNCTFCVFEGCHANMLLIDQRPGLVKATLRGVRFCEANRTYDPPTASVSEATLLHIGGCDELGPPACAAHAVCTEHLDASSAGSGLGVTCECAEAINTSGLPEQRWGFAYGESPGIPGSIGFGGCFKHWRAAIDELRVDACELHPAFQTDLSEASCCALRGSSHVEVTAVAAIDDHGTVTPQAVTVVQPESDSATVKMLAKSFDHEEEREYELKITWVAGDMYCTPGSSLPCLNESGQVQPCISQTLYPVHELEGSMACSHGPSAIPSCGYAQFNFSRCDCPACKPSFVYACACEGSSDGTLACTKDGQMGECDCATPYPYAPYHPSASPPPEPPPSASSSWLTVSVIASLVGASLLFGGSQLYRRYRAHWLHQNYSSLLLSPVADIDLAPSSNFIRSEENPYQDYNPALHAQQS